MFWYHFFDRLGLESVDRLCLLEVVLLHDLVDRLLLFVSGLRLLDRQVQIRVLVVVPGMGVRCLVGLQVGLRGGSRTYWRMVFRIALDSLLSFWLEDLPLVLELHVWRHLLVVSRLLYLLCRSVLFARLLELLV